uniref:Uncharacterized protein n=1 Tax=Anopheles quadriannulatus TaxID=34691 RepID=A0A182XRX0_ANOQN
MFRVCVRFGNSLPVGLDQGNRVSAYSAPTFPFHFGLPWQGCIDRCELRIVGRNPLLLRRIQRGCHAIRLGHARSSLDRKLAQKHVHCREQY